MKTSPLLSETASTITALVQKSNISRTEFASLIDSTPSYVSQILSGRVNLTLDTIERIAKALKKRAIVKFE